MEAERSAAEILADIGLGGAITRASMDLPDSTMAKALRALDSSIGEFASVDQYGSEIDKSIGAVTGLSDHHAYLLQQQSEIASALGSIGSVASSQYDRALSAADILSGFGDRNLPGDLAEEMSKTTHAMWGDPYVGNSLSHTAQEALGLNRGDLGALYRAQNWSNALIGYSTSEMEAILGTSNELRGDVSAISKAAGSIAEATAFASVGILAGESELLGSSIESLFATSAKMSLFAGAIDVLGPSATGSMAAFDALLGDYQTHINLEPSFWRNRSERVHVYREHEVDPGLINADSVETVSVLIESGVVEGRRSRNGTITAVVDTGPVRMEIVASRPKVGAYRAIDSFESALRAFVAGKLESAHGPNWFKHRVPGEVALRAKDRRREAIRGGEISLELIHYVDLADMIPIILRKDNWAEIFEAVFDRAEWLKVDLERLNANRRPTMHSRPIDGVQLCETILVIRKLVAWMEMEGAWDIGWDNDT